MKNYLLSMIVLTSFIFVFCPAQAVTCLGTSCENKDPRDTGCAADSKTITAASAVAEDAFNKVIVQLRYSPTCKTNWTRIYYENKTTTWDDNLDAALTPILKSVGITRQSDSVVRSNPVDPSKGIYWTKMVYVYDKYQKTMGWGYATLYGLDNKSKPLPYTVYLKTIWK
ncbi:MAG: DUF2690 domain-containing protein [Candidatus Methylumidiphilus sp.]